jgi:limonene-1,2-epoxide hydrolase
MTGWDRCTEWDRCKVNSRQATELVHEFGRAWERRDVDGIIEMLDPGIEYQNVPLPTMHGREAVRAFITPNLNQATCIRWEFLHIVADEDGRRVLTERIDTFIFETGEVAVPVMGIFEISAGRILRWRDYADIGSFVSEMEEAGQRMGGNENT